MRGKKYNVSDEITCPHCGASNPSRAYCCLKCFKVIRPDVHVPFLKMYLRPSFSITVLLLVVFVGGVLFLRQWLETIEAEVTINLQATDYNLSVVADKRRARKGFTFFQKTQKE